MVICLERGADLHMAQRIPLRLTVSCFSKIQIGFIFLVPAHSGSHGQRAVKWVCVKRVCVWIKWGCSQWSYLSPVGVSSVLTCCLNNQNGMWPIKIPRAIVPKIVLCGSWPPAWSKSIARTTQLVALYREKHLSIHVFPMLSLCSILLE